jgi:hypothetical protein
MSGISEFFGGGGVPVGGLAYFPQEVEINPIAEGAQQFLRTGTLMPYDATKHTTAVARGLGISADVMGEAYGQSSNASHLVTNFETGELLLYREEYMASGQEAHLYKHTGLGLRRVASVGAGDVAPYLTVGQSGTATQVYKLKGLRIQPMVEYGYFVACGFIGEDTAMKMVFLKSYDGDNWAFLASQTVGSATPTHVVFCASQGYALAVTTNAGCLLNCETGAINTASINAGFGDRAIAGPGYFMYQTSTTAVAFKPMGAGSASWEATTTGNIGDFVYAHGNYWVATNSGSVYAQPTPRNNLVGAGGVSWTAANSGFLVAKNGIFLGGSTTTSRSLWWCPAGSSTFSYLDNSTVNINNTILSHNQDEMLTDAAVGNGTRAVTNKFNIVGVISSATHVPMYAGCATTGTLVKVIGTANDNTCILARSTDNGETWAAVFGFASSNAYAKRIKCLNDNFMLAKSNGTVVVSVDDGLTWNTYTPFAAGNEINDIEYFNSKYIAVAENASSVNYSESSNISAWTASQKIGASHIKTCNVGGGKCIVRYGNTYVAYYTSDLSTFTGCTGTTTNAAEVWDGSKWVELSNSYDVKVGVKTSATGVTFASAGTVTTGNSGQAGNTVIGRHSGPCAFDGKIYYSDYLNQVYESTASNLLAWKALPMSSGTANQPFISQTPKMLIVTQENNSAYCNHSSTVIYDADVPINIGVQNEIVSDNSVAYVRVS